MKINLHMHSTASDGSLTPSNVAKIMKQNDYKLVALTDHDSVDGYKEFVSVCEEQNINCISGVELTTYIANDIGILDHSYNVHILGLNVNPSVINISLQKIREQKQKSHFSILHKYFPRQDIFNCNINNRISCAELLVSEGKFENVQQALTLFMLSDYAPSIKDTIDIIHSAGGVAIWAHPFILPRNGGFHITRDQVELILNYMVLCKIDGIETYYATFSNEQIKFLEEKAAIYGLLSSTGTDFHGDTDEEFHLLKNHQPYDKHLVAKIRG